MPTRLFVYGTLLRGELNYGLLAEARFVRPAATPPAYTLYALDGHPGMGDEGVTGVLGEVFDVDATTLQALDALEGHPDWYVRRPIVLADGERVETYILPARFTAQRAVIEDGDWRRWRRERERDAASAATPRDKH
ncbi:MAG: gamma-glutamylcyclotransferase [Gemmatimonadaceae bacterium]|nr:gamma-glutamylcyclotransferase [Gemmatimonadaceae bacterium]